MSAACYAFEPEMNPFAMNQESKFVRLDTSGLGGFHVTVQPRTGDRECRRAKKEEVGGGMGEGQTSFWNSRVCMKNLLLTLALSGSVFSCLHAQPAECSHNTKEEKAQLHKRFSSSSSSSPSLSHPYKQRIQHGMVDCSTLCPCWSF
jgi:hypothetical protein